MTDAWPKNRCKRRSGTPRRMASVAKLCLCPRIAVHEGDLHPARPLPRPHQQFVRVATPSPPVHEERRGAQALVSRHIPFDPVREVLTDGEALGFAALGATDR